MNMQEKLDQILGKEISQASNEEIYDALLTIVQEMASKKERTDSKKKLYYISAEFLLGKWRAWKTCSVLPGFHCNAWTCGRWCRTELSSWIVQTGI